ncbi:MAG: FliA/WhiG family RNA polymerase sigma factor [bacterium]|nr:FliA/WhiG family RNA polymerase sigma factor [candidate division KSB1 bacterium]MDH7559324.1 FliA/WhiG family RNA polymerase sigma factor [bacterium]
MVKGRGSQIVARYATAEQLSERERCILRYLPLVKRVIGRMFATLPSFVDRKELFQAGVVGLIQAIDQYDPSVGTKLESYAIPRIRGAILDSLREMDWAPRSLRHKASLIERAIDHLCAKLGRSPSEEEIAKELGVDLERYRTMLGEVSAAHLLSLDHPFWETEEAEWVDEEVRLSDPAAHIDEQVDRQGLQERVVALLRALPERERLIMVLYYYEELTFKEIAAILGVTESRVCQLHTQIVLSIRSQLRRDERMST